MFEGVGRIGQYLQMKDLRLQAKTKIKTGQSLDAMREQLRKNLTADARMAAQKTTQTDMTHTLRTTIIRQKLMRGRELSVEELKHLKENDPDLYAKARRAQQTRADLQQALKHARTKEEAQRAVAQAQLKIVSEMEMEARYGSPDGAMARVKASVNAAPSAEAGAAAAQAADAAPMDGAADESAAGSASMNAKVEEAGGDASMAEAVPGAQEAELGAAGEGRSGAEGAAQGDGQPGEADETGEADEADAAQEKKRAAEEKALAKETELAQQKEELKELAEQAKQADGSLPKEKFIFMLMAVMDEWKTFAGSKDYEELPEEAQQDEEGARVQGMKKPYRPTGMANVKAAEGYGSPDALAETGGMLDVTSLL